MLPEPVNLARFNPLSKATILNPLNLAANGGTAIDAWNSDADQYNLQSIHIKNESNTVIYIALNQVATATNYHVALGPASGAATHDGESIEIRGDDALITQVSLIGTSAIVASVIRKVKNLI